MKKIGLMVLSFATPLAAFAAVRNINDIFVFIRNILNTILPIIIALAVVYFIWGIFQYVVSGDEEKRKEGQQKIIYGVVGLFVMISVWGLVNILVNTFGLDTSSNPGNNANLQLPQFNTNVKP
jgi:hypothetical protein